MVAKDPKLTRRLEDYLEAVLELVRRDGVARVRDIAARTGVSMSSVTAALRQLAQMELVHHDPYEVVTLTPRGQRMGKTIRRKHDTLVEFLVNVLSVDAERAQKNACRMEHVVDEEVLKRLSMLGDFVEEHGGQGEDWVEEFSAYCQRHGS
ncbi:MAG: hypothetical protein AMJ81_10510 [Phycisphaerae bacterium SM23_33]|jgi:DtxR family Mn-dependent transcriptional regulator|nr:MAG: hypothetical protein AMJ81_10510 [Phycisphaerae bacterium SM23_33]